MNRIIGALALAIIIAVLLYTGFTKVMALSAENATLKQNAITLTQTNEQNLKAITDMKELSDKVDSLTLQLKHMVEVQQEQTNKAIEGINSLKSKGGEYEMLNTKYPDDPAINCVFHPSSAGCNPDGSRKGETTKVSN
jgi:hypothetical protein